MLSAWRDRERRYSVDDPMLTVLCVLWCGDFRGRRYNKNWVTKLRNMVARNLNEPHEFKCLTNVEVPGVETIPLESNLPGWWAKVELFKRDYGDRMLFIDLDSLIVGNLDDIANYPLDFAPAPHSSRWKGEGVDKRSDVVLNFSSCCIAWSAGAGRDIWDQFSKSAMDKFRGDQDWMGHVMGKVKTLPPEWFLKLKRCQSGPPSETKIVASMPWKNDRAANMFDWVRDTWR